VAARPLDRLYAIVYFDAWRVKIRDEGTVRSKAVYLALGVRTDGSRDILGLWIEQTEGAKFWHARGAGKAKRGIYRRLYELQFKDSVQPETVAKS